MTHEELVVDPHALALLFDLLLRARVEVRTGARGMHVGHHQQAIGARPTEVRDTLREIGDPLRLAAAEVKDIDLRRSVPRTQKRDPRTVTRESPLRIRLRMRRERPRRSAGRGHDEEIGVAALPEVDRGLLVKHPFPVGRDLRIGQTFERVHVLRGEGGGEKGEGGSRYEHHVFRSPWRTRIMTLNGGGPTPPGTPAAVAAMVVRSTRVRRSSS